MARRRWARALPRVVVEVPCGEGQHRVLLHRGKLVLESHTIAAEAVVFGLGGVSPPCVDVYRSWRARGLWEVALEPRGPGFHQLYRRPPLPEALRAPLEAGVVRGWERRAARGERAALLMLEGMIDSRLMPALEGVVRAARRARGAGEVGRVTWSLGASPAVSGVMSGTETSVAVRVAPDWYRTVGHGRHAVHQGMFVFARGPETLVLDWRETAAGRWSPYIRAVAS